MSAPRKSRGRHAIAILADAHPEARDVLRARVPDFVMPPAADVARARREATTEIDRWNAHWRAFPDHTVDTRASSPRAYLRGPDRSWGVPEARQRFLRALTRPEAIELDRRWREAPPADRMARRQRELEAGFLRLHHRLRSPAEAASAAALYRGLVAGVPEAERPRWAAELAALEARGGHDPWPAPEYWEDDGRTAVSHANAARAEHGLPPLTRADFAS